MKKIIILLFFLSSFFSLFAGNTTYRKYSTHDGLKNQQIIRMWLDSKGRVWGSTWAGGFLFDGNKFYNLSLESKANTLKSILLYFYETDSSIVIGGHNGLTFFEKKGISSVYKDYPYIEQYRRIDNKLYAIRRDSVFSICLNERVFKHEKISISEDLDYQSVTADINLNICSLLGRLDAHDFDFGAYLYTIKNGKIVESGNPREKAYEDQFSTRLTREEINDLIPELNDVSIWHILKDKNGIIWLATEQGLLRMPPPAFINYTKNDGLPNYVWSICEDTNGDMWFASYGNGLYKYENGKFIKEDLIDPYTKEKIIYYYIGASQTSKGFLLPHSQGVLKREDGKWSHIKELSKTAYLYVYNDEDANTILFSGVDSLCVYRDNKWEKYCANNTLSRFPLVIVKDKKDRYWMGTGNPAETYIYKEGEFITVDSDEIMFPGGIYSADRDPEGNLWIGNTTGLYCYSYNKVDTIKVKNNSRIEAVKCINDSILLAGETNGLYYIDLKKYYKGKSNYLIYFSSDTGFDSEGVGQQGIIVDSRDRVWIITSRGVIRFHPEKIILPQEAPDPIIYSIKYSSPSLEWEKEELLFVDKSKTIYLQSPVCNIEIDYGAISTSVNEGVLFSYKLEGYHNDWTRANDETRLVVTNLAPGRYKFKVRTILERGNVLGPEKEITFVIKPLFWQTLWFKVFVFTVLILLILYIIFLYFRRSKRKFLREMEITSIQLSHIKSQLNPHFIFNTMNSIGADIIDNDNPSYPFYSKLAKLIRKSLVDADRATKKLSEEVGFVREYLELQKFRFKEKFNYSIEIDPEVDISILIPKMSIQLLVENAVSHGLEEIDRPGLLELNIKKDSKYVIITVSDNGVGFSMSKNKKGSGTGLKNLRKMIEIYNRYNKEKFIIEIKSEENSGTQVSMLVPLNFNFFIK